MVRHPLNLDKRTRTAASNPDFPRSEGKDHLAQIGVVSVRSQKGRLRHQARRIGRDRDPQDGLRRMQPVRTLAPARATVRLPAWLARDR